jgi:phosphohistidine phosphatase
MKRLLLLRHAKSSWDDPSLDDFERPLNSRGRAAAPFMGQLIAARGLVPDVFISSTARRAAETARMAHEACGAERPLIFDERIYDASAARLNVIVSEIADRHASAMLVGHNPGMEGLVRSLTGEIHAMPTAALAVIDLEIDAWEEVCSLRGRLADLVRPRDEMEKKGWPEP